MSEVNTIANLDEIYKGLNKVDGGLNKLSETFLTLLKNGDDFDKKTKNLTQTAENLTKAQKEAIEIQKQLDAAKKTLAASEQKLLTFDAAIYEQLQRNNKALADNKKAIDNKIKSSEAEEGSLVRMKIKLAELTAAYDKTGTRTKEAEKAISSLRNEIGKAEEATGRAQRSVGDYGKIWSGLKSLLPIVSIAAVGTAVVGAFNAIKNSTGELQDKFEFAMSGMNNGLHHFWQTLATGDWSNFMKGMTDAITTGYRYAEMIDKIEDQTRGLSILEADLMEENDKLEIQLRNRNLTAQQRLDIGNKRMENEGKLVVERTRIAKAAFDNEVMLSTDRTKLTEAELMTVARDINTQKKIDAEAYNQKVEQLAKMRKLNVSTTMTGQGVPVVMQLSDSPEIKALESTIKATDKAVVEYSGLIKRFDILTDESKDKFVKSYVAKKQAEVSGIENTRKVQWGINNMTKQITDDAAKTNADATKSTQDKTDKQIKAEQDAVDAWVKGMNEKMDAEAKYLADQDKGRAEQKKEQDELLKWLETSDAEYIEKFNKTEEEKTKKVKEKADKQKEIEKEKRQLQIDLAIETGNAIFDLRNMGFEKELNTLEKEKNAKLSNKNLTEAQKAKIDADFEKKANAIKTKQAQNDKMQALFNIAINTAVASMKTLASTPLPLGLPLLIMTIAMGAIQAGLVMSKPLPKYKDGTMNAERAGIFGEAGLEVMFPKGGGAIFADKPTYFEGDRFKGAQIKNSDETKRLVGMVADRNIIVKNQMTDERILIGLEKLNSTILNKPVAIYDNDHRQIGQGNDSFKEIYINRLIRKG